MTFFLKNSHYNWFINAFMKYETGKTILNKGNKVINYKILKPLLLALPMAFVPLRTIENLFYRDYHSPNPQN